MISKLRSKQTSAVSARNSASSAFAPFAAAPFAAVPHSLGLQNFAHDPWSAYSEADPLSSLAPPPVYPVLDLSPLLNQSRDTVSQPNNSDLPTSTSDTTPGEFTYLFILLIYISAYTPGNVLFYRHFCSNQARTPFQWIRLL